MTFRRLRPCQPPGLRPASIMLPVRFGRRRPALAIFGYVNDVDRDRVVVIGQEAGREGGDLTVRIDLRKVRPTERADLREGSYVVFEVRKGRKGAPQCRFPLRLARLRPWTAEEVEQARERGRRFAASLWEAWEGQRADGTSA